jgi:hypothetical protein
MNGSARDTRDPRRPSERGRLLGRPRWRLLRPCATSMTREQIVIARARRSRWPSARTLSLTIGMVVTFLVSHRAHAMQLPGTLIIDGKETTEEWSRVMVSDAKGKTGSVPNTMTLPIQPGNAPTGNLTIGPATAAMRDGFGNSVTSSSGLAAS